MMVIMTHPLHGRLDVYSLSEVESNKLAGWTVEENAPETMPETPPVQSAPPAPEPTAKPARRGFFAPSDDSEV